MANLKLENSQRERLVSRVDCFLWICLIAWASFAAYFSVDGHVASSAICNMGSLCSIGLIMLLRRWPDLVRLVVHLNLAAASLGITAESMISGQANSSTQWFLVCVGLLAAHQLGILASMFWTCVALTIGVAIHFFLPDGLFPILRPSSAIDKGLQHVALTLVILVIALNAEWTFQRNEATLIGVTRELAESNRMLQLSEAVGIGYWRWEVDSGEMKVSCQLTRVLGLTRTECNLADFLRAFSEDQAEVFKQALKQAVDSHEMLQLDLSLVRAGRRRHMRCSGLCVHEDDGKVEAVFGTLRDDTDTREIEEQLRQKSQTLKHVSSHDSLTGLANRHRFHGLIDLSLDQATIGESSTALLLINMDGFKLVNDTHGHTAGDVVLQQIAKRLTHQIRGADTAARLGADEFCVILNNVSDEKQVIQTAERLCKSLTEPYVADGQPVILGASLGAAMYPFHAESVADLMSHVDAAMYEAKRRGGGVQLFRTELDRHQSLNQALDERLNTALRKCEYELYYQPQVCLETNRIVGIEALLRLFTDDRVVSPAEFVPRLEQTGKIIEVGSWVLNEACRQARAWEDLGYGTKVSINISPIQFYEEDFVAKVKAALTRSGLSPHLLDLEVTEGLLVADLERVAEKLHQIGEMGVSISIDDFGTGYSSLGYLKHLPIDRLKIDQTFVCDIPNSDDGTIAASVTTLAHNLGMKVIAEGVETEDQREFLKLILCDFMQGYLYSPPVPANECLELIRKAAPDAATILT